VETHAQSELVRREGKRLRLGHGSDGNQAAASGAARPLENDVGAPVGQNTKAGNRLSRGMEPEAFNVRGKARRGRELLIAWIHAAQIKA
jgi:hypothetical protein